jgi:hypothetical protein
VKEAASGLPGGSECEYGHVKLVAALMMMGELMFAPDTVRKEVPVNSRHTSMGDLNEGFGLDDDPPAGVGKPPPPFSLSLSVSPLSLSLSLSVSLSPSLSLHLFSLSLSVSACVSVQVCLNCLHFRHKQVAGLNVCMQPRSQALLA